MEYFGGVTMVDDFENDYVSDFEREALTDRNDPYYFKIMFPRIIDDLKSTILNYDKLSSTELKKYLYELHNQLAFYGYYGQAIEEDHNDMYQIIEGVSPIKLHFVPEYSQEEIEKMAKEFIFEYQEGTVKTINKLLYDEDQINFKKYYKLTKDEFEHLRIMKLIDNPFAHYLLLKDYIKD